MAAQPLLASKGRQQPPFKANKPQSVHREIQTEAKALIIVSHSHHWRTAMPVDGGTTVGVPTSTKGVFCIGDAATSTLGVGGVTVPDLTITVAGEASTVAGEGSTVAGEASTELPVPAIDTAVEAPSITKDDAGLSCWLGVAVAYPTNRGGVNDALIFGGVMVPTSAGGNAVCSKP